MTDPLTAAVKAASDAILARDSMIDGAVARSPEVFRGTADQRASAAIRAALPHLLPGLYVTRTDDGDVVRAEDTPAHPYRPEPMLTRTPTTAHLFDALAALLPDRTDEED